MSHLSENTNPLVIKNISESFSNYISGEQGLDFIILPFIEKTNNEELLDALYNQLNLFFSNANNKSTIAILTSPFLATDFCSKFELQANLKLWIAVKLSNSNKSSGYIDNQHAALLVFTKYSSALIHTKTRIEYTYCPTCEKTTKDYGGKKHLYHEYGTLMSDVWRDISVDFSNNIQDVTNRLSDVFGVEGYSTLRVFDERKNLDDFNKEPYKFQSRTNFSNEIIHSELINEDCITALRKIPDNSIDFCFADPPYNIKKKYENWNDGIDIKEYFDWCDLWLFELARILKPGRTLAVLNIPQWCIRHFKNLRNILDYQDWIVWEGLSMPVRMIMPAHYSILCLSKGEPRDLPMLEPNKSKEELNSVHTLKEGFCIRGSCINRRAKLKVDDREIASNLWWDIHRLKHNSRRLDHPCQLPPQFMRRLISMFTFQDEIVLDPFNGVGTTSLTAEQLGRKFIGIELSEYYHSITSNRHQELKNGLDPFRKINDDGPKAKNSPVARLTKQKYEVSKKILQLEVRSIASKLGRIPTRDDVSKLSKFPLEYFDQYFINWGEVCAAARTTGMTETRKPLSGTMPILFEKQKTEVELQ